MEKAVWMAVTKITLSSDPSKTNVTKFQFGLVDGEERTLEQVGQVFGLTRERIRQSEKKAMQNLRESEAARDLEDYRRRAS